MTAPRMTDPGRDWHPTPADLAAARDQTISDVITADLRVLFSGINPGLYSAATGHHFARPGSRFWPALHRSGLTSRQLHPSEQEQLLEAGLGITNVVARATARADGLDPAELRAGGTALAAKVARLRPQWLAVAGVTAYRAAFGRSGAALGPQQETLGGTRLWVLPNPAASMRTGARRASRQSSPGCERRPTSRSEAPACVRILLRNYDFAACLSRMRTTSGATLRPSPRRQPCLCLQLPPARASPPWVPRGGPRPRRRQNRK